MNAFKHIETVAVFDVDETLIPFRSMFVFLDFAMKAKMGDELGARRYQAFLKEIENYRQTLPREIVNRLFYRVFKGWSVTELEEIAKHWWAQIPTQERWIPEVLAALRSHQNKGHFVTLLSGSAEFILAPIADELDVDLKMAIKLGTQEDGTCNGEIWGIQTIGDGKRQALANMECFAEIDAKFVGYGDHRSDLSFLNYCDEGYVVVPNGATDPHWAKGQKILRSSMHRTWI